MHGGLCNRYKCLMEQKKNAAEGIVRCTERFDKKLLVLAIIEEEDWLIVADEFSDSSIYSKSTDTKTTQNVQPMILQDAVVNSIARGGDGDNPSPS